MFTPAPGSRTNPGSEYKNNHIERKTTRKNNVPYFVVKNMPDNVEYGNPECMSVTFEGPLYDYLNYSGSHVEKALDDLFKRYGLYFEQGHSWSFGVFPL